MRASPSRTRPERMRREAVTSTGPRNLQLQKDPTRVVGPGDPPPGFVSATTSASEWILYWGLAKYFQDPRDPRVPPFFGGKLWGYQIALQGGRKEPGGAVVDFLIWLPGETIGIRLQTTRFHIMAGPEKQAYDEAQFTNLSRFLTVRDIYEEQFIGDRSGEAVCRIVADTVGGRSRWSPIRSGTARQVRAG